MKITLKIKRLVEHAQLPTRANSGDLFDLYAAEHTIIPPQGKKLIGTGLSIAFPEGYICFIKDRSGLAAKYGLTTMAGVIDPGYRGEYKVLLHNTSDEDYAIKIGDRIAQAAFLPLPDITIEETDDLGGSERGAGAFGSSGK